MNDFIKDKLNVTFIRGITKDEPIIPRCYTLTHSDKTGDIYLDIGLKFAYNKITAIRDEVLAEWSKMGNKYILRIDLHVDAPLNGLDVAKRDKIFRKELKLAIKGIIYGDKVFFYKHNILEESPIIVYFNSKEERFNKIECWGTIKDYISSDYIEDIKSELDNNLKDEFECENSSDNYEEVIITLLLPYIDRAVYYETKNRISFSKKDIELINIEKLTNHRNLDDYKVSVKVYCKDKESFKMDFIIKSSRIEIKKVEKI